MIYHLLKIDTTTGEIVARSPIGYGITKRRPPASKGVFIGPDPGHGEGTRGF
jgi:hypothetical protein